MGKLNPCYKCEERHVGCHSECDLYLEWKGKHDEQLAKVNVKKEFNCSYNLYKQEVCRKSKRNK